MRERLERGELKRRSLGFDYAVVGLARADDDVRPRDIGDRKCQLLNLPLRQTELHTQAQRGAEIYTFTGQGEVSRKLGQLLFVRFLRANRGDLGRAFLGRELADFPRAPLAFGSDLIDFALKLATLLVNLEDSIDFSRVDLSLG